ncbi:hypothetical protein CAPTEDRAFT_190173 [Capitella teleta]|uniref:Uncharacterized protein n=1 Tax=Capitella teleta TaxID=283909 RepID=R7UL28_CAPTE|nr:hypothetical protein CAPTEDRAFT_190173 [Capitella teleta]|eukprot:ELU07249.1 hypothetical protein CAPTEDRAFT_190173 [Capitella teleta]
MESDAVQMWYAGSRSTVRLQGLSPLPEEEEEEEEEGKFVKVEVHRSWDGLAGSGPGPPESDDVDGDSGHPLHDEVDEDDAMETRSIAGFIYPDEDDSGRPLSEPAQSLPDLDEVVGFVPRRRRVGITLGTSFDSSWSTLDNSDAESGEIWGISEVNWQYSYIRVNQP